MNPTSHNEFIYKSTLFGTEFRSFVFDQKLWCEDLGDERVYEIAVGVSAGFFFDGSVVFQSLNKLIFVGATGNWIQTPAGWEVKALFPEHENIRVEAFVEDENQEFIINSRGQQINSPARLFL